MHASIHPVYKMPQAVGTPSNEVIRQVALTYGHAGCPADIPIHLTVPTQPHKSLMHYTHII